MAHNRNKVLAISNEEGIIHGPDAIIAENTTESFRVEVGYPMGYFWGYKTLGVFQNQTQIDEFLANGGVTKQGTPKPGDLIFQNTDGNTKIDETIRPISAILIPTIPEVSRSTSPGKASTFPSPPTGLSDSRS